MAGMLALRQSLYSRQRRNIWKAGTMARNLGSAANLVDTTGEEGTAWRLAEGQKSTSA